MVISYNTGTNHSCVIDVLDAGCSWSVCDFAIDFSRLTSVGAKNWKIAGFLQRVRVLDWPCRCFPASATADHCENFIFSDAWISYPTGLDVKRKCSLSAAVLLIFLKCITTRCSCSGTLRVVCSGEYMVRKTHTHIPWSAPLWPGLKISPNLWSWESPSSVPPYICS